MTTGQRSLRSQVARRSDECDMGPSLHVQARLWHRTAEVKSGMRTGMRWGRGFHTTGPPPHPRRQPIMKTCRR